MKIFSAEQIRKADQYTIKEEPIKSIDLMERAALAFVKWFELNFDAERRVIVFCGTGNNGGDGLAIGRILSFKGWNVHTLTVKKSSKQSLDFTMNYLKLAEVRDVPDINSTEDFTFDIQPSDIVIDAIFGSGLTRPVKGIYAETIHLINNSSATIVSVDVPSGLFIDSSSEKEAIIKADFVLSFQTPKLAFLLPENSEFVKNWLVADIGLHPDFMSNEQTDYSYIEKEYVKGLLKRRSKFAHKVDFGRVLIMSGSWGKMGAAILCAKACVKSGAGLVTAHIPTCGYQIMQTAIPEVMVSRDFGKKIITNIPEVSTYDAIGIGPGIDTHIDTYEVISQLLSGYNKPIVLDADAINIIADEKSFMKMLPEGSILTPHPGEFKRMTGFWNDDFERLEQQIELSKEFKIYIVLKGAHTSISTPEGKVFFNSTGNPGMATGGSGDVLTGMITSLLGQGYSPQNSAIIGVYLHGLAADIGVDFLGEECLTASDIIEYLPQAFMEIKGK